MFACMNLNLCILCMFALHKSGSGHLCMFACINLSLHFMHVRLHESESVHFMHVCMHKSESAFYAC